MSQGDKPVPRDIPGMISSIDARKALPRTSATEQMLESLQRTDPLKPGSLYGPLHEMRTWDRLAASNMDSLRGAVAGFEARFRIPTTLGLTSGLKEFYKNPVLEVGRRRQEMSALCSLALSIRSPWLDVQGSLRSISGLSGLQGIGEVLKGASSFEPDLSESLRFDLGDWRKKITWPKEIFTDLGARADFYVDLGFDPVLTDFPEEAFRECLFNVGICRERPSLVELYGTPAAAVEKEEEEDFHRNNQAHDRLQRLETQIRNFIDKMMTEAFGPNWPKHKLPNGIHNQWREREQGATRDQDEGRPLIAYADFTDYERVICKRDIWHVFEPYFHRKESVRESFQRLYPIRVDTMHARPITQEDELLLYVETRRLMKEIEKET